MPCLGTLLPDLSWPAQLSLQLLEKGAFLCGLRQSGAVTSAETTASLHHSCLRSPAGELTLWNWVLKFDVVINAAFPQRTL